MALKINEDGWLYRTAARFQREEDYNAKRRIHRSAYHRYFESYSEYYEPDKNGKMALRRVYTGMYYIMDLSKARRRIQKLLYLVAALVMSVLFGFGAMQKGNAGTEWYGTVCAIGGIIGCAWTIFGALGFLYASVKMTIGEWRSSSERLRSGCLCTMIFMCLFIIANLGHGISGGFNISHIISTACFFGSSVIAFILYRTEMNLKYRKELSNVEVPKYAARIL